MSFIEQMLGWAIVVLLVIGSVVAADPFWGPRRASRSARVRADRGDVAGAD